MSRQVSDEPENLDLVVHNLNDPLRDPEIFKANHFDLIHSRFVFPGIKIRRWDTYIRDMRLLLRPGGWVQIMEYLPIIQSHNGRLTDQHAVRKWWQEYQGAMAGMDRDPRIGRQLKQLLLDNRYRDVDVDIVQLHIGDWSKSKSSVLVRLVHIVRPRKGIDLPLRLAAFQSSGASYWTAVLKIDV